MRKFYVYCLALILVATSLAQPSGQVSAAGPEVGSYSRVARTGSLRLRTGPGRNYSVQSYMGKGSVIRIVSGPYNDGAWYKVSYRGMIGYSMSRYLVHTGLAGRSISRSYNRVVVVSLARQQAEVYQGGELVFVSAVTTGRPGFSTPTGTYRVMGKRSPMTFRSPFPEGHAGYYKSFTAQYAIHFRLKGYYFHDISRRPYYGYGTNMPHVDPDGVERTGSIGCVNMPLWSVKRLYDWINVGTVVRVVSY